MNVKQIQMLVDLAPYVPILLEEYNVTVHKVLKEIHIGKVVMMQMNVQDHHVEEMLCVQMWKDHLGVRVQKVLKVIQ